MTSTASRVEVTLAAAALAVMSGLFFHTAGNVPVSFLPVALLFLVRATPHLAHVRVDRLAVGAMGVFLFFDAPAGEPFLEYDPLTEEFGALLFDPLHNLFHITVLRLSVFEIASFALLAWIVFKAGRFELQARLRQRSFQVGLLLAALIPLMGAIFAILGLARGGSPTLIIPQIRPFPVLASWMLIGLLVANRDLPRLILKGVVAIMTLKALQGLYVYYFIFGGTLGKREYLLAHATSDYLAMSLLTLGALAYLTKNYLLRSAAVALIALTFLPYIFNERRASYIGVAFSFLLAPFLFRDSIRPRHLQLGALALVAAGAFTGATWGMEGPLGAPSSIIIGLFPSKKGIKKAPDYRLLENFSLVSVAKDFPVTGMGFGRRFPMIEELPDMSKDYGYYDLIPHNSVFYLWAATGPFGMAALGTVVAVALAVMMQVFRRHSSLAIRVFAFVAFSGVIRWLVFVYADMGLMEPRLSSFHALMIGVAIAFLDLPPVEKEA